MRRSTTIANGSGRKKCIGKREVFDGGVWVPGCAFLSWGGVARFKCEALRPASLPRNRSPASPAPFEKKWSEWPCRIVDSPRTVRRFAQGFGGNSFNTACFDAPPPPPSVDQGYAANWRRPATGRSCREELRPFRKGYSGTPQGQNRVPAPTGSAAADDNDMFYHDNRKSEALWTSEMITDQHRNQNL